MNIGITCRLERMTQLQQIIDGYGLAIEINDFIEPQILNNPQITSEYLAEYKKYLAETKLKRTFHGPFYGINLCSADYDFVKLSAEKIRKAIRICRELDCSKIIFHTGYMPVIKSREYTGLVIERQIEFWKEIAGENEDQVICLENMFEPDSDFLLAILEGCNAANLQFCLDIAHCVVFSNEKPLVWAGKLGRYLSHVHLSDCNGREDEHLALGAGKVAKRKTIRELLDMDDNLTFVIEISEINALKSSLSYLQRMGLAGKGADFESR